MQKELEWTWGGAADTDGARFKETKASLNASIVAIGALTKSPETLRAGLGEIFLLCGRALDYLWTLKTLCRVEQSMNALGSKGVQAEHDVAWLENQLAAALHPVFQFAGAEDAPAGSDALLWRRHFFEQMGPRAENPADQAKVLRVLQPLKSMHGHLLNEMQLTVDSGYGYKTRQTFSQAVSALKTSSNPGLTSSVFLNLSSWCAEHAPLFADILNAVYGWRCSEAVGASSPFETAIRRERCEPKSVEAMTAALSERSAELQALVARQCGVAAGTRVPVASLYCTRSLQGSSALNDYGSFFWFAEDTYGKLEPTFREFLARAAKGHWIEASSDSAKAGGAWCDNLPSEKAVFLFVKKATGPGALCQLAHLLGVGFMHWTLHGQPSVLHRVPLSVTEIAGMLCETSVSRMLLRRADGAAAEMRAQALRRLVSMTMFLPMRHRLAKRLLEARQSETLTVSRINGFCREAWQESFGDSVIGCDQYVWAYKPHFYRTDVMFYDWQYTFGYLLSQLLWERFSAEAPGLIQGFLRDAAALSCEDLILKHLGKDIRSKEVWLAAIDSALAAAAD